MKNIKDKGIRQFWKTVYLPFSLASSRVINYILMDIRFGWLEIVRLPMGVRTGSADKTTPCDTLTSWGWTSVGPSTIWMIWTSCSRRIDAGLRLCPCVVPPAPPDSAITQPTPAPTYYYCLLLLPWIIAPPIIIIITDLHCDYYLSNIIHIF